MSRLSFESLITPTLWITLAVLAAAVQAWYARARPAGVARRRWMGIVVLTAAATVGILLILLNPIWLEVIPPPAGKPVISLLVDQSASMAVQDAPESKSRFAVAIDTAADVAKSLSGRFDVRI